LNKKVIVDTTEEVWDRTMGLDLRSVFLLCKNAISQMVRRGSGSFINISSIGGLEAFPEFAAYSTSKGDLISLTKKLGSRLWEGQNPRKRHLPGSERYARRPAVHAGSRGLHEDHCFGYDFAVYR
jgi:hypothetical protein